MRNNLDFHDIAQKTNAMWLLNELPAHGAELEEQDAQALGAEGAGAVYAYLASRGASTPTPLHALPALAAALGLADLRIKDEGFRLGLRSFKALGGGYAATRLALEVASARLGREVRYDELGAPEVAGATSRLVFACATDGNHGRSLAEGARHVGSRCVIYIHAGVSEERAAAIEHFGAEVVRISGDYDASVAEAARAARDNDWLLVSDTSWPGYERVPLMVMQGYAAILAKSLAEMRDVPTHIFIQAGVGGVAAAVAAHAALTLGVRRPRVIVVEPQRAACVLESARAGRLMLIPPDEPTVMAMLECREPSLAAWRVLSRVADAFMTVDEAEAVAVMNLLARPSQGDPAIVSGESGGVGLAGLIKAAKDPALRAALGLDARSRVWLVNTEGATDPRCYRELTGLAA